MSNIWTIGETLDDAEKNIIIKALRFYHYNKKMTASALGVSLRGLDGKIKRHGIKSKEDIRINND